MSAHHPVPRGWEAARAEHWHGSDYTSETTHRDETQRSRADKPKTIFAQPPA